MNTGRWVVLAIRGGESHWVVLPTRVTAERARTYWNNEGWYTQVRRCSPPVRPEARFSEES
jgi:hypothetical protein